MIITITLNPAVDKTVEIPNFQAGVVNRVVAVRYDAGGKGINVSKVIGSLGGRSKALGLLGGATGRFIQNFLDQRGIENAFHFVAGETRTNLKVVDGPQRSNTDINEPGPPVSDEDMAALKRMMLEGLTSRDVVVFSGSAPANVDRAIYGQWIAAAKQAGALTILDADGDLLLHGLEAGPHLVKPNIHELERLFGRELGDVTQIEQMARTLLTQYGIQRVVVSLGEQGALFVDSAGSVLAHGLKVAVQSTVGAGDALVAALAYAIDQGCDDDKTIRLAVATSAANVMTSGTQAAEYATIAELEPQVRYESIYSINK